MQNFVPVRQLLVPKFVLGRQLLVPIFVLGGQLMVLKFVCRFVNFENGNEFVSTCFVVVFFT